MTYLETQTKLAKQIRKAHPKKIWTDCIKAAAKELKAGKAAPKKAAPKKRVAGLDKVVRKGNHTNVEYSRKPKAVAKKKTTQAKLFGVGKSFTDFKKYKNHVIDIETTKNGKKIYVANGGVIHVPFYCNSLAVAKKFIDRAIALKN